MGLACAPCSAIRTPPRLHGALTQSPVPGHVLAHRQLIWLSKKPTGWGAAILQREALGVQGHTLSRAQVASSWRLTLVCWPPPGFAPVCVALGCVWPGEALHTPPASRPDARPSPWAALEDCGVRGCGRARVRGPASPTPTAPSLGAWEAERQRTALAASPPAVADPGTTARASDGRAHPGNTPPRLSPLSVSSAASSLCVPANCSSPHPLGERSSDCPPRARRCPWADVAQTDRTPPPWGWHGAGGVSIHT